jgi:hypothetical protein
VLVAAAICLYEGYGLAQLYARLSVSFSLGSFSMPIVLLTLTAGAFLFAAAAQLASAHGFASGFAVLIVGQSLEGAVLVAGTKAFRDLVSARDVAAMAFGTVLAIAATLLVLRAREGAAGPAVGEPSYRSPPAREEAPRVAVPAPASGVTPLLLCSYAISLVIRLEPFGMHSVANALRDNRTYRAVGLVLIALVGGCFTWFFNAPTRVACLRARVSKGRDVAAFEVEARGGMREAVLRSVLFLIALFVIGQATFLGLSASTAVLPVVATATAIVLDIAAEWRARRAMPDLVTVWPEHRLYALAAAREALAGAGIPVHARGENVRTLLQFGGPFAPIDLMVRRADAKRAAGILDDLLRLRPGDDADDEKPVPTSHRRWTGAEGRMAGAVAVLAAATLLLPGSPPPAPLASYAPARPDALRLLEVDDEADPFAALLEKPPEGVTIMVENVSAGPNRTLVRRHARVVPVEHESMDQARSRLVAWAGTLAATSGLRVLAGPVSEYSDEKDRTEQIGWRTWLVKGSAIVDGSDVKLATAAESGQVWSVAVELGPEGAERFRAFTRSHLKRRLAIVVDGVVQSAPVIQAEIPGGHVSITFGSGDEEEQMRQARELQDKLLGR